MLQEEKRCFSLLFSASVPALCMGLCIGLHWEFKGFKAPLSTIKKVHYVCNIAYHHGLESTL